MNEEKSWKLDWIKNTNQEPSPAEAPHSAEAEAKVPSGLLGKLWTRLVPKKEGR